VSTWPDSSCSSRATRARSASWASTARRRASACARSRIFAASRWAAWSRLSRSPGDEREQGVDVEGREDGAADLEDALDLVGAAALGLVAAHVVDRHGRLRGQGQRDLLVLLGERDPARLVRQVEVAERLSPQRDRDPQERRHGRMVGREAGGARVVAQALEAQGAGVADQHAEDALPARERADQVPLLLRHAGGDELRQLRPRRVEHPQRGVARPEHRPRRLHDLGEQVVERQLLPERQSGVDEAGHARAVVLGAPACAVERDPRGEQPRERVEGPRARLVRPAAVGGDVAHDHGLHALLDGRRRGHHRVRRGADPPKDVGRVLAVVELEAPAVLRPRRAEHATGRVTHDERDRVERGQFGHEAEEARVRGGPGTRARSGRI
jgi:hypothetical protein